MMKLPCLLPVFCLLAAGVLGATSPQPDAAAGLRRLRIFPEALVPVGPTPPEAESVALRTALQAPEAGRWAAVEEFLAKHPGSAWAPSLLLNRGLSRFDRGYFGAALADWTEAWKSGGRAEGATPDADAIVARALAEAVKMLCRVGRVAEAKALLAEFGDRPAFGVNASLLEQSRKAIVQMEKLPDDCFKCGPFALGSILKFQGALTAERHARLTAYATTAQGTSLAEVARLARGPLGLDLQTVRRATPQSAPPLPAVVHWKLDHYGALLEFKDGRYLLVDPTFGTSQWIEAEALAQEASGYFLVPAGKLPAGFLAVAEPEAGSVWGRGNCREGDGNGTKKNDPKVPKCPPKGKGRGMADWSIHHALASLNLEDTPLAYQPPFGPDVAFRVNYSQLEQNQPTTLNFSNVGPLWNFNWVSSLTFDSNNAFARLGEGGTELYTRFNGGTQTYDPEQATGALLVRVSATVYERRASDGSKLVFASPDGSGRIFLTQDVDPQGNALTFGYDANFRLVTLTDAAGQVTTIEHGSNAPGDPLFYRVTKVTDPFGRFTTLAYNASAQLTSVTDTIGIVSQFGYDASGKVNTLTTPYGVTSFSFGFTDVAPAGLVTFVEVTEPNGAKQRVESVQTSILPQTESAALIPAGMPARNDYLQWRNSFYWDRRAMAEAPGDYNKAQITHFLHLNVSNVKASVIESEKAPLENRVWYFHQGQTDSIFTNEGMRSNPTHIGRVLDDGRTQLTRYSYNAQGNITEAIDPVGRTTRYTYAANGIDLLTVRQVNAAGGEDLIGTYTWNGQHRPLTFTDASGATTTYTYNARGQTLTVTNPRNEVTTFTYDAQGYLTFADGPLPGTQDRSSFGYDAAGRLATVTTAEGYVLNLQYDNLDRPTRQDFPDGTYEEVQYTRLDPTSFRDRGGRVTGTAYNSVRQPVSVTDPAGGVTSLDWCACGSLRQLIDPLGRALTWEQDLMGRPTAKIYADRSRETYVYETTTSRLAAVIDPRGQARSYLYHLDDRIEALLYPTTAGVSSTPVAWFSYDPAYPRMRAMTDGTGVTTYTYGVIGSGLASDANRLIEVHSTWTNSRIVFGYDEIGRLFTRSVDGAGLAIQRDASARVAMLQNALGSFGYAYEGVSARVSRVDLPNGQVAHGSYFGNAAERRLQQVRNLAPGGALLSQFDYAYDAAGRLASWQEQAGASPARSSTMTYDANDQLTGVSALGRVFGFTYDAAGNLRTRTLNGSTRTFSFNVLNELQSASPALGSDKSYTWDAENRLVRIDYAGTSSNTRLTYDGAGRCVGLSEYNADTLVQEKRFVWSGYERVEERTAAGVVTRRFFPQGEQVGSTAYFYTFDHLGNVRELTDASGAVRARYEYDPFGARSKLSGDLEATAGFTGHYFHPPSGLHLTAFRAYDAATGRWLSRDPLGEIDGLNLYAYVRNRPLSAHDPLGLWTGNLGVGYGGQAGVAGQASGGVAFDGSGNVGTYVGAQGGVAVALPNAGAGVEFGISNAPTARDFAEGSSSQLGATLSLGLKLSATLTFGKDKDGNPFIGLGGGVGLGTPTAGISFTGDPTGKASGYGPLRGDPGPEGGPAAAAAPIAPKPNPRGPVAQPQKPAAPRKPAPPAPKRATPAPKADQGCK